MANRGWEMSVDVDKIIQIDGDDFEATISATYTHGNQVVKEKMVQLFVPGADPIEPQKTDENGKVIVDGVIIHTNAKEITIEAQAVGYATRGRETITLPRPEKKKGEEKMKIDILGPCGSAKEFFVSVFTENPLERLTISSNVSLTMGRIEPPPESTEPTTVTGIFFDLKTGPESNLYLKFSFEGQKAICIFRYPAKKEVKEKMLIK